MLEFQKKKKLKRFFNSPLMLIVLFVVLIIMGKAVWRVYDKEHLSVENLKRQTSELSKLVTREQELAQSINYLKTDDGVEAEIRSKFRFAKDGESVAVIIDDDATSTKSEPVATTTNQTFWQRFLDIF